MGRAYVEGSQILQKYYGGNVFLFQLNSKQVFIRSNVIIAKQYDYSLDNIYVWIRSYDMSTSININLNTKFNALILLSNEYFQ